MSRRAVSVADLRTNLGAHLERVRSGQEVVISEDRRPIAKIVPISPADDVSAKEAALAAMGVLRLPQKRLPASFWKTSGPRVRADRGTRARVLGRRGRRRGMLGP